MSTWPTAHRVANLAAAQAHAALDIDRSGFVDVDAAICGSDILLLWRPMPRLFGAYINEPGARPGIIVNSNIPRTIQRHTAAHELAHHRLGHGSRLDQSLELAGAVGRRGLSTGLEERVAEAFASWFLMPLSAVRTALDRLGLTQLATAENAYRLSLLLGTSYRVTVRHLPNLGLLRQQSASAWLSIPPARLRRQVAGRGPWEAAHGAVWLIDSRFRAELIHAGVGDYIVLQEPTINEWNVSSDMQELVDCSEATRARVVLRLTTEAAGKRLVVERGNGSVEILVDRYRLGLAQFAGDPTRAALGTGG